MLLSSVFVVVQGEVVFANYIPLPTFPIKTTYTFDIHDSYDQMSASKKMKCKEKSRKTCLPEVDHCFLPFQECFRRFFKLCTKENY